jgi:hypothetical protein
MDFWCQVHRSYTKYQEDNLLGTRLQQTHERGRCSITKQKYYQKIDKYKRKHRQKSDYFLFFCVLKGLSLSLNDN